MYREQRVDVYWILDAEEASAEVWTPDAEFPVIERERLTWYPTGASAPLLIDLATFLAE